MNRKLLLVFDFDDTLTIEHTFIGTSVTLRTLKHPERISRLIQEVTEMGGLLAIATECPFEKKIKTALSLLFDAEESEINRIPIVSRQTDGNGKNWHIAEAIRIYGIRPELYFPILFDDGITNVECALNERFGGIVVPSESNTDKDPYMTGHIDALGEILGCKSESEILAACNKHNSNYGISPPQRAL